MIPKEQDLKISNIKEDPNFSRNQGEGLEEEWREDLVFNADRKAKRAKLKKQRLQEGKDNLQEP